MPVDLLTLVAFLPASLALNLTPGIDMLFSAAQGMRAGPRSAWAASAGISTGSLIHALVAGLGLAAVVAAVPGVLDALRWIGVAYLLWLAWRSIGAEPGKFGVAGLSPGRAFVDGMLVNLANPKVFLFVLAFIPQFVDPARPVVAQFLVFGLILAVGGFFINGSVGAFAAQAAYRIAGSPAALRRVSYVSAAIFLILAVALAVSHIAN